MEKQDLKNLLENIYHLLAEEAPPPKEPKEILYVPPYGAPIVPIPPNPNLSQEPPRPPMPPLPTRVERPPVPPCDAGLDCWFKWIDTLRWEWDIYGRKWVLRGQGADGTGGYWKSIPMPEGWRDGYGNPHPGDPNSIEQILRGLGILRPNNYPVN